MNKKSIGLSLLCLILVACGHDKGDAPRGPLYMIYSPTGAPLNGGALGRPLCQEAYRSWFQNLDVDHTGKISQAVFMADAEAIFVSLDQAHSGVLASAEVEAARAPYRQYAPNLPKREDALERKSHPKGKPTEKENRDEERGSGSQPDPVMAADINLDFKVTHEEFTAQMHRVFAKLDREGQGWITLSSLGSYCEPK